MKTKYREQFTLSINFYNIHVNLLLFIFFKSTHLSIMKLSKLITMKYDVTKSICIPSGTGSGMVIPVSSVCCWKTEGLWGFFSFLFLPSLSFCYSKLSWHSSHPRPPVSEEFWRYDTLGEFKKRRTLSETLLR